MSAPLRAALWVSVALALASLIAWTLSQLSAFHIQDDSYMFVRYADNVLASGRPSWDPDGPATYGPTSLLFLAFVVPLRAGLAQQAALCAAMASLLLGVVALALTVGLATFASGAPRGARLWIAALVLAPIGLAGQGLGTHLTNGMDTTLAVTMTALLLTAWVGWSGTASTGRAVLLGCCGGLAFTARPDLGLYAVVIPAAVALLAPGARRSTAWIALGVSVLWIGAQSTLCAWYFGTPVPLSFYVKSASGGYGEAFRAHWAPVARNQLTNYVINYGVFFALIAVDVFVHWRRWLSPARALRTGVLVATVLHMTYYTFGAFQVIGFHQRFYYPTLPALAWLAACAAVDLAATVAPRLPGGSVAPAVRWLAVLALACLPAVTLDYGVRELLRESSANRMLSFDLLDRYRRKSANFWLGLDRMIDLPDGLVIATTEVGHPAALLPRKRIVDLAGLNETEFAMHGFSAERLFAVLRPDFIYMPHPDYREMSAAIRADPRFVAGYECFEAAELHTKMGVALLRSSPYYASLAQIVADARPVEH